MEPDDFSNDPIQLRLEGPSRITGTVGTATDTAPMVVLTGRGGRPIPNARLVASAPPAALTGTASVPTPTDANGRARVQWTLGSVAGSQTISIESELAGQNGVRARIAMSADARAGPMFRVAATVPQLAIGDSFPRAALMLAPSDSFGNVLDATALTVTSLTPDVLGMSENALIGLRAGIATLRVTSGGGEAVPLQVTVQPFRVTRLAAPIEFRQLGGTFPAVVGASFNTFGRFTGTWATSVIGTSEAIFSVNTSNVVWNSRRGVNIGDLTTLWRSTLAAEWVQVPLPPSVTSITSVHGARGDTVLIVAQDSLWRFDGARWTATQRPTGVIVISGREWVEYELTVATIARFVATRVTGATRTILPALEFAWAPRGYSVTGLGVAPSGSAYLLFREANSLTREGGHLIIAMSATTAAIVPDPAPNPQSLFVTPAGSITLWYGSRFVQRNGATVREYIGLPGRTHNGLGPETNDRMLLSVTDWWGVAVLLVEPLP